MQVWGSVKNAKIIGFLTYLLHIFWDILKKKKTSLAQECIKRGLLSFQFKIRIIAPDCTGKMRVSSFGLTCPTPLPLKSVVPTHTKFIFLD